MFAMLQALLIKTTTRRWWLVAILVSCRDYRPDDLCALSRRDRHGRRVVKPQHFGAPGVLLVGFV